MVEPTAEATGEPDGAPNDGAAGSPAAVPRPPAARAAAAMWLLTIGLALGLRAASVDAGLRTDDYVQLALLDGDFPIERASWDLFWFGGADGSETRTLVDAGYLPWWTSAHHRVAMLRPLSSLLLALDQALFDDWIPGYHLHALLWLVALLWAVSVLLRPLLPFPIASLALLLYALDEAHNVPAGWLANRSTLVATTFGVLALGVHTRARAQGRTRHAASAGLLLLSLAAGEYGLCVAAFIFAFECVGTRDPAPVRVRAAAPTLAIALAYVTLRAVLGYGPRGSGYYLSPLDVPGEFLARGIGRCGALLGELTLGLPAAQWHGGSPLRAQLLSTGLFTRERWQALPSWHTVQALIGFAGLALLLWLARRHGQRWPTQASTLRWMLLGSLGSLVVVAGSLPGSRLLAGASLGISVVLALIIGAAFEQLRGLAGGRRALLLVALAGALLVHGLLPAAHALETARQIGARARAERAQALSPQLDGHPAVLLVSASDFATAAHIRWIRQHHGASDTVVTLLSGAPYAHDLRRSGPRSLELSVLSSDLTDSFAGSLVRSRRATFELGQTFEYKRLRVTVLAVRNGNPGALRFDFPEALESLPILHAGPEGLRRITIPAIGETLRLPRATAASATVGKR